MSVIDLRREFRKLQEEFLGGALSKMKKHEVEHRMAALKSAMAIKADTPAPPPASAGAPGAREVKSKEVLIDDETKLIKPVAPKGGMKHATSYKKGGAKKDAAKKSDVSDVSSTTDAVAHVANTPAPAPAAASAAEKPKKPRRMPPKVELSDDAPAAAPVEAAAKPERKVVKKVVKKEKAPSKATAAPNTEKPAPEPEPVPVAAPKIKMPGGCRPLPGAEVSFG